MKMPYTLIIETLGMYMNDCNAMSANTQRHNFRRLEDSGSGMCSSTAVIKDSPPLLPLPLIENSNRRPKWSDGK